MNYWKTYYLGWIGAIILLLLAVGADIYFLDQTTDIQDFKKTLVHKESEITKIFQRFQTDKDFFNSYDANSSTDKKDAIIYLIYEDNELIFWTNNTIDIPEVYEQNFYKQPLLRLNNGFYATYTSFSSNHKIVALIPIYYEYNFSNSFLNDHFHQDFSLRYKTYLSTNAEIGHFIKNKEGQYLCSLVQSEKLNTSSPVFITISLLYFISFLLLFCCFIIFYKNCSSKSQLTLLFILSLIIWGGRAIMLGFQIPASLYSLQLFAPKLHASSAIFRSLGDYWLNALTLFLWLYTLSLFNRKQLYKNITRKKALILCSLLILIMVICSLLIFEQIKSLVLNSSFSLQVHKGSGIEIYSIWAYAGVALFFSSILMFIRIIIDCFQKYFSPTSFYKIWTMGIVIGIFISLFFDKLSALHLIFLTLVGLARGFIRYNTPKNVNYILQVLILLFSTLYLTLIINIYTYEKEEKIRSAKAESIIDSNDPRTKALLETMGSSWKKDKILKKLLRNPIARRQHLKKHLREVYFNKSWGHYNVQITSCTRKDSIEITDKGTKNNLNCLDYFQQLLQSSSRIGNSPFYELKKQTGVSSYIGKLSSFTRKYGKVQIFIQLDLKPYRDNEGYTELLVGNKKEAEYYQHYSFAKYIANTLRYSSGDFNYYTSFDNFKSHKETTSQKNYFCKLDGYNHYVYAVSDDYKIIVSEAELSLYRKYIAFPYIFFLLFFLFLFIWILESSNPKINFYSFRQQIKIALTTMTTLVFFVVGGVSLYSNFASNQEQYIEEHQAKIQMLRKQLFSNIESAKDLIPKYNPNLQKNLNNYAHILGADINIYDTYGVLLATSHPDIFNKGVLSNRMNYKVLQKLNKHKTTEEIAQEHIGKLEYSSVYVTLWNNKNEAIAYLNVPYFMKYKKFKAEMQDIIVGVLNINLILIILALFIAFAISQRITHPLVILRKKFAQIRIGQKNEKIHYPKEDEIKVVINAYNKMVEELEENAELLAQSERESAWREMARQVAHEIKNPLTPMKLNIQFLQRSLEQKDENWQNKFKQSATVLLTQIDELSAIASAFSDFAKLPETKKEKIDLLPLLQELVLLYNKGSIKITLLTSLKSCFVVADQNQLRRAFINLISNAMQSIQNSEEGKIEIAVTQENPNLIAIRITDNGKGIPEEIRSKIFQPNFTTKSSGTGLGLALTKNIINQFGGTIDFESQEDKGTTFRIKLPTTESH